MKKNEEGGIDVIIETPRGSRNKYIYDEKANIFRLKKILPAGAVFPFDFGFFPGTMAEDGDPLDVLLIMEEPAFTGCMLSARVIGALKAKQSKEKKIVQNDRLIAVPVASLVYHDLLEPEDLNQNLRDQIQHFFVSYNEYEGKKFIPEGWANAADAKKLVEQASFTQSREGSQSR